MKYLLDTNVISEMISRQQNAQVVAWVDNLDPFAVYLSAITVGEISKGIAKLSDSKRKDLLNRWLMDDLLLRFDGHILPVDTNVMLAWGQLAGELAAQGIKLPGFDSLIAVTALHHRCILVTRNETNFRNVGVTLINPWKLT